VRDALPLINPFPGLRPFEADEDHLFFGREQHVDELLRRLRFNRFLSIVGTSGCGKSSLIRSGLIPSLHGGLMVKAGSSWRISVLRPGEDPLGHLAEALAVPEVIGVTNEALAATSRVLVDAALRRGKRGLIDAVRQAHIPPEDNVLVVVDQFEELFRFQRSRQVPAARDEAVAFVNLLLEASSQSEVPIYVVLTMRSDFIGECMEYAGLPEALNAGQYLVPRMTRDELRSAITGPVAVAGGEIAPRFVQRLLNEVGSDQDQLPVLQHALMRTWDHWAARPDPRGPIDFEDYEAVGDMRHALSRHAEEAFEDAGSGAGAGRGSLVAERMFRALTDVVSDPRGVRRPCSLAELAAVAEAPEDEVARVIEVFRKPGRSFLMPPASVALDSRVIVDLSHESLMRCWTRLQAWAEDERASAAVYLRLTRAAQWFEDGTAGLWRDPELGLGLKWRTEYQPSAAWARRYDQAFDRAMLFLDNSERERDRLATERRAERRRQWRQLQWVAAALAVLFVVTGIAAVVARRESARARAENARAEQNLRLARTAVDESLAVVERDPSLLGVDVPEIVGFRRDLLEKAQRFYLEFIEQAPDSEEIRREMAFGRLRLGHIDRALDAREQAVTDYRAAIGAFEALAAVYPDRSEYRRAEADAQNWLGEALRRVGGRYAEAKSAYDTALTRQQSLVPGSGGDAEHRQALARTRYNRGILLAEHAGHDGATLEAAEMDLRESIRLLEPLAAGSGTPLAAQELGRAYNNLGSVVADMEPRASRLANAQDLYGRAVAIHEGLAAKEPGNREYAMELIKFYNNLSDVLRERGQFDEAQTRNAQALDRIEVLARPASSVGIERADSYNLRGRIAQDRPGADAVAQYRRAFELYRALGRDEETRRFPEFHLRFGDLLVNLAILVSEQPRAAGAGGLLEEALRLYLGLVASAAQSGTPAEARSALDTMALVGPLLTGVRATSVSEDMARLQPQLEARVVSR
jgi:tetratricopeptide (TPR) repeat protein/energy-coupling factor transporter ATP-binding protein EcfA2